MKEKINFNYLLVALSVALVLSAVVISFGFKNIKPGENTFMVTGSATTRVVSDNAKLNGSISKNVQFEELTSAYSQVANDISQVKKLALKYGIKEDEINILAPSASEQYSYNQNGEVTNKSYNVSQRIIINSNNVDGVTKFANATPEIAKQGIFFENSGPEYYYSKLPETRVSLLGQAVKDAKDRALSIAKNANSTVGALHSVSGGIVQVLAPNSTDISDYGSYDTSTVEKDVMVTVKAEFSIK